MNRHGNTNATNTLINDNDNVILLEEETVLSLI